MSNIAESPCELAAALSIIRQHFDVQAILDRSIDDVHVVEYYRQCDQVYALVHCPEGALHLALSRDGAIEDDGYYQHIDRVHQHLVRLQAEKVLEIGCGNGFNLRRAARLNPQVQFTGVDLAPDHVSAALGWSRGAENLDFRIGDFADMPFLANEQFDLVFAIEAICQGTSMPNTLGEVHRVLKPGGLFIVFDCFRGCELDALPDDLQVAARLVEKTTAVESFWPVARWRHLALEVGFREHEVTDLTAAVRPDLLRLQAIARSFFGAPALRRELSGFCSPLALENAVSGLVMPITVAAGVHGYYRAVLERPRPQR